jgi:AhpD family alkylhydroperoxidase
VQQVFAELRRKLGFVPNLVRLWAHSRLLLRPLTTLEVTVGASGRVPSALKELAAARVSELNRCPYCRAFHHARLGQLDVADDKTAQLAAPELPEGLFTVEERVVLQLADEMTLDVKATPETVARVRELFGLEGAIELMAIVATLNADNRMALSAALVADQWPR